MCIYGVLAMPMYTTIMQTIHIQFKITIMAAIPGVDIFETQTHAHIVVILHLASRTCQHNIDCAL